jgi:predicted nuclease with RNAse H fold
VITAGVDLAAEPAGTAVASIRWEPSAATVSALSAGADDEALLAAVSGADKAGIDCPFGWPDAFVAFLAEHQRGHIVAPQDIAGRAWRRHLANRVTDLAVRQRTGLVPLSVAADRIGYPAMRCAGLLAALARRGLPVERDGTGLVVEVYPAAALHGWGLPHRGYKGGGNLSGLVDRLAAAAPWLNLGRYADVCRASHDAFDAVVAALIARAAALGRVTRPDATQAGAAATEGWIALPTGPLASLITGWPDLPGST